VLQLRVHIFPLPYHRNGFITSQGAYAVAGLPGNPGRTNSSAVVDYFTLSFENLAELSSGSRGLTEFEFRDKLAGLVQKRFGFPASSFLEYIQPGGTFDAATRLGWKYAAGRGISGTPQYIVNGVPDATPEGFSSLSSFQKYVEKLAQPQYSNFNVQK
jgi:hypothetical protein